MADKARLAVDIGGTFTDLCLEWNGKLTSAKVLTTPRAPEEGVLTGMDEIVKLSGAEAGRPRHHHPRHDARHQRHHRAQGRPDGADRHRRLPRFDRDRLRASLRAVRHLHGQAVAAGAARPALRRARAHGRPRQRADRRSTRRRCEALAPKLKAARRRGDRDRLHARLSRRRARAAHARHPGRDAARRVDLALERGLARDPRVRALVDRGRQRLRAAGDGPLSWPAR